MPFANRISVAVMLATALPALGADQWVRLSTPHFELYTLAGDKNGGEKKGRDAILTLEQVRGLVTEAAHANWDQAIPVRVISFQSDKQLKPFESNSGTTTYSSNSQSRDYFVMLDSDPDYLPLAVHQEVHLIVLRAGLKLPAWLIEGWADVFSTLKPASANAIPAGATKDHIDELKSVKWLDFNTLTSVNERSSVYNEKNRLGQFYAESWALVHMFYLGRDYHENFGKLVAALNDGKTAAEAFQTAYNRTSAQVYADLQAYVKQNSLNSGAFPNPQKAPADPVVSPVSDLESGVMLADLLAATNKREQAKAAYDKLAQQYPGASEISESLGYYAWQNGDSDAARKYFEAALPGTKDPQMCYHLAMLYHDAGQGTGDGPYRDKLIATLTKAVALKPDYAEARLQLGLVEYNLGNYPAAVAALSPIDRIAPEHAAALYGALAYAYARTGAVADARKTLDIDRKWVKTDAEKARVAELTEDLDASAGLSMRRAGNAGTADAPDNPANYMPAKPPIDLAGGLKRVEGEAQALDCNGARPRLSVLVGGVTMIFEIADPNHIAVRHEGSDQLEFVCGAMKRFHVTVDYLPGVTSGTGVAGTLKVIEF